MVKDFSFPKNTSCLKKYIFHINKFSDKKIKYGWYEIDLKNYIKKNILLYLLKFWRGYPFNIFNVITGELYTYIKLKIT